MTPDQLREVETELGLKHGGLALALGVSEVSVKRMATGSQVITEQTAKQLAGLLVIEREGLKNKYAKVLAKYHHDTIIESSAAHTARPDSRGYRHGTEQLGVTKPSKFRVSTAPSAPIGPGQLDDE